VPVIPIIGARKVSQLEDNLASLDLELSTEQLKVLDDASRIELGFPYDLYNAENGSRARLRRYARPDCCLGEFFPEMVRSRGLEPPHPFGYMHLKHARLQFPVHPHPLALLDSHRRQRPLANFQLGPALDFKISEYACRGRALSGSLPNAHIRLHSAV
jgi:hypothetical protein